MAVSVRMHEKRIGINLAYLDCGDDWFQSTQHSAGIRSPNVEHLSQLALLGQDIDL
jgi:hypothetical protein